LTKILMVKVPTFEYPSDVEGASVAELVTFSWTLSLALASIAGFLERYYTGAYTLEQFEMNGVVVDHKGTIDEAGRIALKAVEKKINETDFDVLAVSVQFLFGQKFADDVIAMAKRKNPAATVIAGGGFATIFPEQTINNPLVDYAVIGEGEHTFVHILNRLYGIDDPEFYAKWPFDGYAEKLDDGEIKIVPKTQFLDNLGDLPQPLWKPEDLERLEKFQPGSPIPVMASRGCPMGCSFCSTHLTWGKPVRFRPADDVVREILVTYERYDFKNFHFVDDNITFKNEWFADFCERMSMAQPEDIKFTFSNFDMRFLDVSVLRGLKKIGVKNVTIATESGVQEVQRQISKKLNLDRDRSVVKDIHAEGLNIHNCFIIGFPNETLEQIHETVAFARELRTESIQIWPAFPFPGTRLYDEAKSLGFVALDEEDYGSLKYRKGGIVSTEWDVETVKRIAYDANIELNFLATPYYDTEEGRKILKGKVDGVAANIKGHAVAAIVSGYLEGEFYNNSDKRDACYDQALTLLREEDSIFRHYLHMQFPVTEDFRGWVVSNRPEWFAAVYEAGETDITRLMVGQSISASQIGV